MRNLAAVLITCLALQSEMIDRIAVTVDNRVIAESEIIRQIRITAFLNGEPPDFSAANKRTTADRLVEQALIRRELETTRYAAQGASAATEYQELKKKYPDEDAYKASLANNWNHRQRRAGGPSMASRPARVHRHALPARRPGSGIGRARLL